METLIYLLIVFNFDYYYDLPPGPPQRKEEIELTKTQGYDNRQNTILHCSSKRQEI